MSHERSQPCLTKTRLLGLPGTRSQGARRSKKPSERASPRSSAKRKRRTRGRTHDLAGQRLRPRAGRPRFRYGRHLIAICLPPAPTSPSHRSWSGCCCHIANAYGTHSRRIAAENAWRAANHLPPRFATSREPIVRLDKDHGWPEPPAEKFDPLRMFYAARRILMGAARRSKK